MQSKHARDLISDAINGEDYLSRPAELREDGHNAGGSLTERCMRARARK